MDAGTQPLAPPSQQTTIPFTTSYSRRYACDRCRGHKLRCNRDLTSSLDSPCQRCRKAKARCTIGAATPGRRPNAGRGIGGVRSQSRNGGFDTEAAIITGPQSNQTPSHRQDDPQRSSDNSHTPRSAPPPSWDTTFNDHDHLETGIQLESLQWQDVFAPLTPLMNAPRNPQSDQPVPTLPTPISPSTAATSSKRSSHSNKSSNGSNKTNVTQPLDLNGQGQHNGMYSNGNITHTVPSATTTQIDNHLPFLQEELELNSPLRFDDSDELWPEQSLCITYSTLTEPNIQAISQLTSSLITDLHRIMAARSTNACALAQASGEMSENTIGKLLQSSERFLEITRSFNHSRRESYAFSERSFDLTGEAYNSSAEDNLDLSEHQTEESLSDLQNQRDVPSTFALLACYTSLLQIYDSVFSVIHQSLSSGQVSAPHLSGDTGSKLPPTISGLINGFMLQNHRVLQLRILNQVSMYMLESIEKTMRAAGVLDDVMFQTLLKAGLRAEGQGQTQGIETGMGSVREKIKKIEAML